MDSSVPVDAAAAKKMAAVRHCAACACEPGRLWLRRYPLLDGRSALVTLCDQCNTELAPGSESNRLFYLRIEQFAEAHRTSN